MKNAVIFLHFVKENRKRKFTFCKISHSEKLGELFTICNFVNQSSVAVFFTICKIQSECLTCKLSTHFESYKL